MNYYQRTVTAKDYQGKDYIASLLTWNVLDDGDSMTTVANVLIPFDVGNAMFSQNTPHLPRCDIVKSTAIRILARAIARGDVDDDFA